MLRAVSDWWIDLSSAARKFILGALAVGALAVRVPLVIVRVVSVCH